MGLIEAVRIDEDDCETFPDMAPELNLFVGQLTPRQKVDAAVQHALSVSRALSMGNYHSLFHLYEDAPNMGAYIMDHFINRERVKALLVITKAYVLGVAHCFAQLIK